MFNTVSAFIFICLVFLNCSCTETVLSGSADAGEEVQQETLTETPCQDNDGDGFLDSACGGDDCDDTRNDIFPGCPSTIFPPPFLDRFLVIDSVQCFRTFLPDYPDQFLEFHAPPHAFSFSGWRCRKTVNTAVQIRHGGDSVSCSARAVDR